VNGLRNISSVTDTGDDTVEFELTPDQLLELSQAAEAPESVAPTPVSALAGAGLTSPKFSWSKPLLVAGAIVAYAAFAWWSASQFAIRPQPPAMAVARPTVVAPRPALITSPSKPAVQLINPFDATEVFEFPAGTSRAEGREKVAQILLQRARERQSQWERTKPTVNVRTASLYRAP
jgi:hypothetical protein